MVLQSGAGDGTAPALTDSGKKRKAESDARVACPPQSAKACGPKRRPSPDVDVSPFSRQICKRHTCCCIITSAIDMLLSCLSLLKLLIIS